MQVVVMQMTSFCWPQIERMVNVCQSYAEQNNLIFSTDPTPALSKPKCILFCGRSGQPQYNLMVRTYLGLKVLCT